MAKLTDVNVLDMQGGKVTRVSLDNDRYYAVDEPQEGDIVKIAKGWGSIIKGEWYSVEKVESGYAYIGSWSNGSYSDVQAFRKQSATNPTPDLTQRVDAIDARVSALEGEKTAQHTRPITSYDDLAVGMALKCVKSAFGFSEGNTYKIVSKDSDGDYEAVNDSGRTTNITYYRGVGDRARSFEIVSGGYPAPEPALAPSFKVGDYAKVTRDVHEHRTGDIVLITERKVGGLFDFRIDRLAHNHFGFIDAENLEPATDAEVAQAKRAAKFTALGRKVDEYRTGDIVAVIGGDIYSYGTIGVVGDIDRGATRSDEEFRVVANGKEFANWHGVNHVELLAPVEARVDAQ